VLSDSGNPYDAVRLLAVEQAAGRTDSVPLMMWNPPWLLVVMQPVLRLPYGQAAAIWLATNIVLAVLACMLVVRGYRSDELVAADYIPALFGLVVSVPLAMTMQLGQVSILLLFAMAVLYWSVRRRREIFTGFALALLTVKPHLFLLVAVIVTIDMVQQKRWGVFLGAFAATAALLFATYLIDPTLFRDWAQAMSSTPAGAPAALVWRTPNVPNVVRAWLSQHTRVPGNLALTVVPVLGLIVAAAWWSWRGQRRALDAVLPGVLCWSVIMAPFGWTFDHVVLAVPQIIILVRAFTEVRHAVQRWLLLGAVIATHAGLLVQMRTTDSDYSQFWWYPMAVLLLWVSSTRLIAPPAAQPMIALD
jgi:hypothetical protein